MKRTLSLALVGLGMVLTSVVAEAQTITAPAPSVRSSRSMRFRYFDPRTKQFLSYEFGKKMHTERIAYELTRNANALCWSAHRYYKDNPDWRITYREMYKLVTDAEHIQKLVKEGYHSRRHDKDHIIQDLLEMDRLVNHVRDDVRYWVRDDSVGGTISRFLDDETVLVRLAKLEDTLHHLMRDYGVDFNRKKTVPATAPLPVGGLVAPRPN